MNMLLIATDGTFPPETGGIQTLLHNICCFTRTNVSVLATRREGSRSFDREQPYHIRRIAFGRRFPLFTTIVHAFVMAVIKRPHVIVWGHFEMAVFTGWLLKKILRIPLIVYVHGLDLSLTLSRSYLSSCISLFCLKRVDLIFTNSQYNKSMISQLGTPSSRIHLLHPGVDPDEFHPNIDNAEIEREYNLSGKKVLLTVSRLVMRKNHEAVLRVMPALVKEVPDLTYVIVGDGPEQANLECLVESLNLGEHVLFTGSCSPEKLTQFYNACDLFILPSKTLPLEAKREYRAEDVEGFGIVFVEAGACGKPVIGGNSGGIPDAIVNGKTGYLVDPDNRHEIKKAIKCLLLNPEKAKEMGRKGRSRVIDELSWQKVAGQFDSQLMALLAE